MCGGGAKNSHETPACCKSASLRRSTGGAGGIKERGTNGLYERGNLCGDLEQNISSGLCKAAMCGDCRLCEAESSAGARQRHAAEEALRPDYPGERRFVEFAHRTRKSTTYVRLADVAALVTKPIAHSHVIMAVLDGELLRNPIGDEVGVDHVPLGWLKEKRPEAFGGEAKVNRRPDKAAAREQRKYEVEKVVKCGLHGHLLQKSLEGAIRDRVRAVSESTNRAGLMLLDIVLRNLDRGSALPEFDQTFFRRLLLCDRTDQHVSECLEDAFASFPMTERFKGDGQLYSSAAKAIDTNFKNSVVFAFEARQKRYVTLWCSKDPEARGEPWPIIKAINLWGTPEEVTAEGEKFVNSERSSMGLGARASVTATWLKGTIETVLKTYRRWLSYLEDNEGKLFCLTPIWSIKSHFIKFDTDAMFGLMNAEELYRGNHDAFKDDSVTQFESVFKLQGLACKDWTFSRMVETDGVALCVHFRRPKTEQEIRDMKAKEAEKAKNKVIAADKKSVRERSPERVQREFAEAKAAKKLAAKQRTKEKAKARYEAKKAGTYKPAKDAKPPTADEATTAPSIPRPVLKDGDLSQDPGNNPNVSYTVHIVNGKKVRRRFTIGRYYTEGGVKRHQRRTAGWLQSVQAEQDTLDDISLKTSVHACVRAHIRRYAAVHKALWDEKTKSRWARGRLDTYIRKPKALDKFFKEIKKDGPVLRSFYGGASCSSTIPGTKPAPKTLCLRRARKAFPGTTMVDEYLTTQCCWKCLGKTQQVARMVGGHVRVVRGLVYCDSSTCGCFRDRDFQGAMNIMACGVGPRPTELARTEGHVRRTDKRFLPAPMKKQCVLRRTSRPRLRMLLAAGLSQN